MLHGMDVCTIYGVILVGDNLGRINFVDPRLPPQSPIAQPQIHRKDKARSLVHEAGLVSDYTLALAIL